MITAEGIVGKVVAFIVNKTVGKLINLPFDKRRKACRALTKLYYCVQTLDDATEEFYRTLIDFEASGDAEAMVHALNNNKYKIEQASNMFIELGEELFSGLEIIDPALASCCNALYVAKFNFLSFMSNSIEWDRSDDKPKLLVKTPMDNMLEVDLEDQYKKAKLALSEGDKHYWPSSILDDFNNHTNTVLITFDNADSANHLKKHIDKHRELLAAAKESLRNLLKDNFSIEEVLFQNDSHPWR